MCRLFALNAAPQRIHATFWLLNTPDSFISQSRRNPDGTGLGYYDDGGIPVSEEGSIPIVDKEPVAAYEDRAFLREAREVSSTSFISHIRFATTGAKTPENCHPFVMDDRLFAHNGALGGLEELEAQLGSELELVKGQTDSERFFALITKEIRAHDGNVRAGIAAAVRWIAKSIPVCSMNFVLAMPQELWAFRYPEIDKLYVLERAPGGRDGDRELHYTKDHLQVHSPHLRKHGAVVVASEALNDDPNWRLLRSGELIHVTRDQTVESTILIDHAPAHVLTFSAPTGQPSERQAPAHA
jgi:predicted glutamine amidotransferase